MWKNIFLSQLCDSERRAEARAGRVLLTQWLSRPRVAEWQAPSIFSTQHYARYVASRESILIAAISTRRVFRAISALKAASVCVYVFEFTLMLWSASSHVVVSEQDKSPSRLCWRHVSRIPNAITLKQGSVSSAYHVFLIVMQMLAWDN